MEWNFLSLLGIFLSGLALNLTPCIYPMLSVTVGLLGGRERESVIASFRRALAYGAGIMMMYSVLGVVAALTGHLFGEVLQNPYVLLGIAVLMAALALSMFGLYELQMPAAVLDWLGGKRRIVGFSGIFLSGLFVGIFAAPCIGPPIVALLTIVGKEGNPLKGFLLFFILSIGLGLPYLVLGTFSGLLSKLPKSGEWMIWVKKVFGVILVGAAFFYMALAAKPNIIPFIFPMTLGVGGIYLGFFEKAGNQNKTFRRFKQSMGTIATLSAFFILFFAPTKGPAWEPYSLEKLAQARQEGKPVVIDFYADWCIACHELDQFTYSNPKVIAALEPFVRLKNDLSDPNSEEVLEVIQQYQLFGVPTVIFLDRTGNEVPDTRIDGFVSADEFLELVDVVRQANR